MRTFIFLFIIGVLSSTPALAQKKVAMVKLIRGDVDILTLGKTTKLKADDWVEEGAVVKTSGKSFVKLIFIDKSQMNVGPNSEMKIENFSGKDSGVIELVKGKIRSQVTKDYLQMDEKDKSKLFIKTKNAVMGVRGTDFMISTDGTNSSVVLFEGEVVFNKLTNRNITNTAVLEQIVERGVRMFPGEFSVVEQQRPMPTVPSLLNIQQRESLEKSDGFETNREPSTTEVKKEENNSKSVVPPGLNGEVVSNNSTTLKNEVPRVADAGPRDNSKAASANPDGFVKGDTFKPRNGSFLNTETGKIHQPSDASLFDPNSNTFIAGSGGGEGRVDAEGKYIPPKESNETKKQDSGDIVTKGGIKEIKDFKDIKDIKDVTQANQVPPDFFKDQYQQLAKPTTTNTTINVNGIP